MHYQPKCQHKAKADSLCISRSCEIRNCFCCLECRRKVHKACEVVKYKVFVNELHKRQGINAQQLVKYEEKIQKTFTDLIKSLKQEFISFREQFQRFNAPGRLIHFYDRIKYNQQILLTGRDAKGLLDIKAMFIEYELRDQISFRRQRNNIMDINQFLIQKLRPYYNLSQSLEQREIKVPEINQIKQIQQKFKKYEILDGGLISGQMKYIQSLFDNKRIYSVDLLYKASQNSFSCKKFHEIVDQKKNILILARTEYKKTIGCWCPVKWSSPDNWKYIECSDSFLFSMQKQWRGKKFIPFKTKFSIGMHKDYGPIFGDDFVIYDKANTSKGCWSNFPDVYNSREDKLPHDDVKNLTNFIGCKDHFEKFNLLQWQAYKINFDREQALERSWVEAYNKI